MELRRPSHVRFGVLGFAYTLSLITYLDRVCIMRARPDIQRDLGFSNVQMGWVFSAFLLGYLLFEVPGGLMGDWWGPRRVLTRIVVWWSVFTTLTGCVWAFTFDSGYRLSLGGWSVPLLLDGLVVMLLVRFLFGAGEAGAYPNLTRVVRTWFPFHERAYAQGRIWMSARLGGALAPFIIGRLSAAIGWRLAFATLGGIGIAWAVAFFGWFRDRPEQMPGCNDAERDLIRSRTAPRAALALPLDKSLLPASSAHDKAIRAAGSTPEGIRADPPAAVTDLPEEAEHGRAWPPLRSLVSSLTLWGLGLAAACVSFGWYFYPTWQPEYLREVFGISYDNSEIITGLPFLCGAVGALMGGRLSDHLVQTMGSRRWGRSLVGVGGFTAAGLCVLASGFVNAPWQAVALLCLASLVNDLAIPVIWAVCADVGGRFSGTVAGIMNMLGGVGGVLSPALIPQAREALQAHYSPTESWRLIFVGLATAWFIGAAAWLVIDAGTPMFKKSRQ